MNCRCGRPLPEVDGILMASCDYCRFGNVEAPYGYTLHSSLFQELLQAKPETPRRSIWKRIRSWLRRWI
jgi:hypothetical protein